MKRRLTLFLICACASLVMAQRGPETKWKLTKVRDGQNLNDVNYQNTDFIISIKKKIFLGYVGCNRFKGKLEYIKGDSISPIVLVSTKIACPDYIDGLEYATLQAIDLCDKLVFRDNKAEFYNQTRLMLVLEKK